MPYGRFITYNLIGSVLWTAGLSLVGYYFGKVVPNAGQYVLPITLGILLLGLPFFVTLVRKSGKKQV